jgi:hypothetical protein
MEGGLSGAQKRTILGELDNIRAQRLTLIPDLDQKPENGLPAFISYAREDEALRATLGKHLAALQRQGLISVWHDGMIKAGSEWKEQINSKLKTSKIILPLISVDFMDSEYCRDIEMKRALERHQQREALVVPIILRPVNLNGTPFAKLQALPRDARPVTSWPDLDSALLDITEGVNDALRDFMAACAYPAP